MSLPSVAVPQYKCIIPSTGIEIEYRPFLVKEEKLLLIAQEGGDQADQVLAIARVLADCISTPDIEIGTLATFDIEYLFLKLRSKSVGEVIELSIQHPDSDCEHTTNVKLNIDDIEIPGPIPDNKISLDKNLGVVLKFPTFQDVAYTEDSTEPQTERLFDLLASCVEYVYDDKEVYNDFTKEEMIEWLEHLPKAQFDKITGFFENAPSLKHTIKWKCRSCKKNDKVELQGMQGFFT